VFWVISVFTIRNTLPKSGTFLLGHPLYVSTLSSSYMIGITLLTPLLYLMMIFYEEEKQDED
jgi:hypothetical protein